MTLTKEWLQQTIEEMEYDKATFPGDLNEDHGNVLEAFKLALAGMEVEPVGEVSEQSDGLVMDGTVDLGGKSTHRIINGASKMKRLPLGTKFYTAPQPLTTSERAELENYRNTQQVVPELKPIGYLFVSDQGAVAYSPTDWGMAGFNLAGQIFGNIDACRAAMLQGAENVESRCSNSPVIQDGWVMVPVEPTDAMVEAMYKHQLSMRGALKAAIAAAPQQEAE